MKAIENSIIVVFLLISVNLNSQVEFLAGHLSAINIASLTQQFDFELYTVLDSPVDSISICYGDGICERIGVQYQEELNQIEILKSIFQATHVYPGQAHYQISIAECCWSSEGLNTSEFGNSLFWIIKEITFTNPIFNGPNNSPIDGGLINIITGSLDEVLNYTSSFYDPDGDSLSLEFITPRGDSIVTNDYQFPDQINPGGNNIFTIEPNNFIWDSPQTIGNYHIAYELTEYRGDVPIASSYGVSLIIIQDPTSVNHSFRNKFKIYPNPTKNVVKIEGEKFDKLEIYNLLGEKLISKTTKTKEINLSNLPNGIYLLSIFQDEEKHSTLIEKIK